MRLWVMAPVPAAADDTCGWRCCSGDLPRALELYTRAIDGCADFVESLVSESTATLVIARLELAGILNNRSECTPVATSQYAGACLSLAFLAGPRCPLAAVGGT